MNRKELEIYKKIKQAIILQKLKPNTQLVEKELAESFHVSRTPIRNVLRRLQYERLVKIIEHKGAFVAGSTVEEEQNTYQHVDYIEATQMAGEFHLKIAEMAGNSYFYQYLEDLISVTYIIIPIYGRGQAEKDTCRHPLHIFDAIKKRDEDLAEKLCIEHLREIEDNLHFNEGLKISTSLSEIFQ
ncbi:GntR family transcriptional regulator [Metabacillus fastidiosus]|uniref:GntR family transcriptional regulator n=1 Tax=Metabacillus fastidiosus TaxID=1458 RepID=UPI002E1B6655|nr:GntR family transcriptional regulator [Metabacillus fastidiosus]